MRTAVTAGVGIGAILAAVILFSTTYQRSEILLLAFTPSSSFCLLHSKRVRLSYFPSRGGPGIVSFAVAVAAGTCTLSVTGHSEILPPSSSPAPPSLGNVFSLVTSFLWLPPQCSCRTGKSTLRICPKSSPIV